MGVIGLVLLLVAAASSVARRIAGSTGGRPGRRPADAVAVPEAELPDLGEPRARARRARRRTRPRPTPPSSAASVDPAARPAPGLGTGVSAAGRRRRHRRTSCSTCDADDPATPASTVKLLTAAAALDHARTRRTPLDDHGRRRRPPGEVVLVGGGDPTLSAHRARRQTYPGAPTSPTSPRRSLAALPAGTPVTRVVVDGSLFTGPLTASGWGPADAPSSVRRADHRALGRRARRVSPRLDRAQRPARRCDAGAALADALGARGRRPCVARRGAGRRDDAGRRCSPRRSSRLVEQTLLESATTMLAEVLARQVAHRPRACRPASPAAAAGGHRRARRRSASTLTGVDAVRRQRAVPRRPASPAAVLTARGARRRRRQPRRRVRDAHRPAGRRLHRLAGRPRSTPATAAAAWCAPRPAPCRACTRLAGTVRDRRRRGCWPSRVVADGVAAADAAARGRRSTTIAAALAGCGCR